MPLDNRTKKEIRKLIEEYLEDYSTDNQYGISNIPFHTHNGTDAPLITALPDSLITTANDWQFDGVFSPTSNTVTAWAGGTLIFSNGDTFNIVGGNTGTMSGVTYIYFDELISKTAFQTASATTIFTLGANYNSQILISSDGKAIYVPGATISKYSKDLSLQYTTTAVSAPMWAALDDGNKFLYVINATTLYKLNTYDLSIVTSVVLNHNANHKVFISPDSSFLYVTDFDNNELHKFKTSDLTEPVSFASTGVGPFSLVVSPDGTILYLYTAGGAVGGLRRFNTSTLATIGSLVLTAGAALGNISISPDGTLLYVTSSGNLEKFNTSLVQQAVVSPTTTPRYAVVSKDGTYLYLVGISSNKLIKFNTSDLSQNTSISTSGFGSEGPVFDALTPDRKYVYTLYNTGTAGLRKFDATNLSSFAFSPAVVSPTATIIGVSQNVATGKNAIFVIFGGNALNGSGKIITSADMDGILTNITSFGLRDTSAAFDVTIAATSSPALSAGRTLTIDMSNVAHTLDFGTTANTITFPSAASDTVVFLTASQAITGKTYNGLTLTSTTGTFTLTNGKTLTVSDSTTLATNSITFAGTEVLTLAATKSVTFADAFITSGANSLTLTTTGTTNVTLPTSGTLAKTTDITITNAEANDSITPVADATYTFDKTINTTIAITTKKGIITNVVIT